MKAVIYLDVHEWLIGQDVTVYFPDTMLKHGKCELLKEQDAVAPKPFNSNGWLETKTLWKCGACGARISKRKSRFCEVCGKPVKW